MSLSPPTIQHRSSLTLSRLRSISDGYATVEDMRGIRDVINFNMDQSRTLRNTSSEYTNEWYATLPQTPPPILAERPLLHYPLLQDYVASNSISSQYSNSSEHTANKITLSQMSTTTGSTLHYTSYHHSSIESFEPLPMGTHSIALCKLKKSKFLILMRFIRRKAFVAKVS
jgi:hypothetical protein